MTQLSFGDAEHAGKRKRTRREVFLAEMDQVVPWTSLLNLTDAVCGGGTRPASVPAGDDAAH